MPSIAEGDEGRQRKSGWDFRRRWCDRCPFRVGRGGIIDDRGRIAIIVGGRHDAGDYRGGRLSAIVSAEPCGASAIPRLDYRNRLKAGGCGWGREYAWNGAIYPYIDIRDANWLRSAVLFWDEIQTIAPTSIHNPYHEADTKIREREGYLAASALRFT